ncbi:MAG: hypothetical protein Q7S33_03210 [Nanoarchaeota archaeon]|nr:hypothetical protein [Nanoarchaeota archaeon]
MINLAGNKEADVFIQEELLSARIPLIRGTMSKGEVPYSISGQLKNWNFQRAWRYWIADAEGLGLPLEVASELHERKYPITGERQPLTYGEMVRVVGHCGCPHPKQWAFPVKDILYPQLQKLRQENISYGDLAKLCNEGIIVGQRFVQNYHIDSQEGLNEFARVINQL